MLYNRNWDKPDVHSLDSLIEWLSTKPPEEGYHYLSSRECLCAQYYRAKGFWFVIMKASHFYHGLNRKTDLPAGFNNIAQSGLSTFGEALKRAHATKRLFAKADELEIDYRKNNPTHAFEYLAHAVEVEMKRRRPIKAAPMVERTTCA